MEKKVLVTMLFSWKSSRPSFSKKVPNGSNKKGVNFTRYIIAIRNIISWSSLKNIYIYYIINQLDKIYSPYTLDIGIILELDSYLVLIWCMGFSRLNESFTLIQRKRPEFCLHFYPPQNENEPEKTHRKLSRIFLKW